ncbi:sensor histidine kinase [Paenibacillus sp. J5C2022]|uniref:sensor histidine kinase n=1 Tax=Paenibacillus sp. J5C2022 TaxID=2977129 RepID=UPI0021D126D7|nr:sensor histidine kinase [Paenibacillus sp. J5C2022]
MRSLFNKYIRNRFFNKLLLMYSVIIIVTVGILIAIIVNSITGLLREQAITYNNQVLQLVSDHFHDQNKYLKKMMTDLYIKNGFVKTETLYEAFHALSSDGSSSSSFGSMSEQRERAAYINRYMMNTALPYDLDILEMVMSSRAFDYELNTTRYASGVRLDNYFEQIRHLLKTSVPANINERKTYFLPAFSAANNGSSMNLYGIYDYIRHADNPAEYAGYMILTYDTESFRRAYETYRKYLVGTLLVLTPDGDVIYDSSGAYYARPFPYWEQVQQSSDRALIDRKQSIVNVSKDDEFGFITVGIIPLDELHKGINRITRMVLAAASVCLLITILLTVLSTNRFSKRLKDVQQRIKEIQSGNLAVQPVTGQNDEVALIARNLNLMSKRLDEYIKREFVLELRRKDSELKQKTAELYALQSQINPHFLYNTLEAIRMKALSSRDTETGQMIKILAKLFRSSIKEEMMITIREEMNYCQSLLELYYIRFQGRLDIVFDVEEAILDYAVFRHILQPIIENSIAHGNDLSKDSNVITVRGRRANEYIVITVSDNGQGMDEERLAAVTEQLKQPHAYGSAGSIGLINVASRIKLLFGEDCGLAIASRRGIGTEVTVTIKALSKEELKDYVQNTDRG